VHLVPDIQRTDNTSETRDNAENRRNNKADERRITRSTRLDTLDAHLVPTRRYGKTLRSSRTTRKPPAERGSVPNCGSVISEFHVEENPVANERPDVAGTARRQRLALRPSARRERAERVNRNCAWLRARGQPCLLFYRPRAIQFFLRIIHSALRAAPIREITGARALLRTAATRPRAAEGLPGLPPPSPFALVDVLRIAVIGKHARPLNAAAAGSRDSLSPACSPLPPPSADAGPV